MRSAGEPMAAKVRLNEFFDGRRKGLDLPSLAVTKQSKAASRESGAKRKIAFNVDSLDKAVAAFEENERALKAR